MKNFLPTLSLILSLFSITSFATVSLGSFNSDGYIEAFLYPPHNEFDPNPKIPFDERYTARYGLDIETTLAHKKYLPRLFGFVHAFSAFGDTRPQTEYNFRADPIVMDLTYGAGYRFTTHSQLRISTSRHINLGKYKGERLLWSAISYKYEW